MSSVPRYLCVFVCAQWNATIGQLANELRASSSSGDFIVSLDVSGKDIDVPGFANEKHTDAVEKLGLAKFNKYGPTLWFCWDYVFPIVHEKYNSYDYYVFVESDARLSANLDAIISEMRRLNADLSCAHERIAEPDWVWYRQAKKFFNQPRSAMLSCTVISKRALSVVYEKRKLMSELAARDRNIELPICEAVVPSVIAEAGMLAVPLERFVDTSKCGVDQYYHLGSEETLTQNSLTHPVVDYDKFCRRTIDDNGLTTTIINILVGKYGRSQLSRVAMLERLKPICSAQGEWYLEEIVDRCLSTIMRSVSG